MKLNPLVIVNLFICIILLIGFATIDIVLVVIGVIAFAISIVGMILLTTENYRAGFWIYVISMIMFIPIGLIGIIGARKMHDVKAEEEFKAKRQASQEKEQ
jgi:hypothetical protein